MWRRCLALVALLTSVLAVEAQVRPKITLTLPSGIDSETVQIDYFLAGPFGGYGGLVRAESKKVSYDIDPFVDGRPADNVKIIAYLPGCEIVTLDFAFTGTPVEQWLNCYPLGSVSFRGQVPPASTNRAQSREIEVSYLATWSHRFFGISDGPVTTIRLGTAHIEKDGKFEIVLPDLFKQSTLLDGTLQFFLQEPKTGNILAYLKPAGGSPNSPDWLSVQASYPIVRFVAEGHLKQAKP